MGSRVVHRLIVCGSPGSTRRRPQRSAVYSTTAQSLRCTMSWLPIGVILSSLCGTTNDDGGEAFCKKYHRERKCSSVVRSARAALGIASPWSMYVVAIKSYILKSLSLFRSTNCMMYCHQTTRCEFSKGSKQPTTSVEA